MSEYILSCFKRYDWLEGAISEKDFIHPGIPGHNVHLIKDL
jgi:hypothetical protein